ncbi:MAG: alpha/beta fold hydrolase [Myxococcota bacterium]
MKRWLGSGIGVVMLVWLYGAWGAGYFLLDRGGLASLPTTERLEDFSRHKHFVEAGRWTVASIDEGQGTPVVLLHGCPFHSYEWRYVIPQLSERYRVIAPDLLGLGDTPVRLDGDYRLPNDAAMVLALLDSLGLREAFFVGHDHGAATLQLLMKEHPERILGVVLTNAEAYDQWPSAPERPYLALMVNPVTAPLFRLAMGLRWVQHEVFAIAHHDPGRTMTDADLDAYLRASLSTPRRSARFRRFFRWQLDPHHNRVTLDVVDGLRRFHKPTLIAWGREDTNFGPEIAERLAGDIPGSVRIDWFERSAHMPMEEEPEAYGAALLRFFGEVQAASASASPSRAPDR